jgi:hypothetical protein
LDATFVERPVRLVGFGLDEAGGAGRKKTGTAKVSSIDGELFRYAPDPSMTCAGDSGGPVFADLGAGERLVGVTRSGDAACKTSGTAVRVDGASSGGVWSSFVMPYLAAVTDGARAPFDRGVDECTATCTKDEDCPPAMICFADRTAGVRRCGLPSLLGGRFGDVCRDDATCGGGTCVQTGDDCRCFAPCDAPSTKAAGPGDEGGGCDLGSRGTSRAPLPALLALVVGAWVRSRARSRI